MSTLLTRSEFTNLVLARDGYKCVICGERESTGAIRLDAHHIIERRLFPDGGYYLDNGATLCDRGEFGCHYQAEQTIITCEEIRERAGITHVVLPEHLYSDVRYDKWGNPYLESGLRLRGELFDDESVQKVLHKVIHEHKEFTKYIKYPRTYHLPWSPNVGKDDRVHTDTAQWTNMEIVITEKMDGENTTMYNDYLHARSIDGRNHHSRNWVKNLHARIAHEIPDNWRICGETLYAKHSIHYTGLPSYFMVFSIWDGLTCLSWDDTVEYTKMIGLETVPVLYRGSEGWEWRSFDLEITNQEGYVIRPASSFHQRDFTRLVGKYVRKDHVQTHAKWTNQRITPNELKP